MNDENVNKNIEESARKVNNSKEATNVVKEMRKIIKSNKCSILWLAYQQGNIFEKFKANYIYINMVNHVEQANLQWFLKLLL